MIESDLEHYAGRYKRIVLARMLPLDEPPVTDRDVCGEASVVLANLRVDESAIIDETPTKCAVYRGVCEDAD